MKTPRLFTRTLAILAFLFGVMTIATALCSAWIIDRNLTAEFQSKGKAIADSIADSSVELLEFRDASTIQAMIDQYPPEAASAGRAAQDLGFTGVSYVLVEDAHGEIVSHTFVPAVPPEIERLVAAHTDQKNQTTVKQLSVQGLGDMIDIASPILGGEVGFVHVGMNRGVIQASVRSAILKQTGVMVVLFAISVVVAYLLVRKIAEPLNELTTYAQKVASSASLTSTNGSPAAALLAASARDDEVGQLAEAFQHMVEEVSARELGLKQAEFALRRSEEHFRSLIENVTDIIIKLDAEGTVLYASSSVQPVLGIEVPAIVSRCIFEFVHPSDRQDFEQSFRDALQRPGVAPSVECRMQRHDGTWPVVEAVVHNLLSDPVVGGAVVNLRDITDRKRAAEALQKAHDELELRVRERTAELSTSNSQLSREIAERQRAEDETKKVHHLLDSIVENIPNMIFVKDAVDLRFLRINKTAERLLGLRREEMIGKSDHDFFPTEQANFFIAKDRLVLDGGTLLDIPEEEIKTQDGKRVFHTVKLPIVDDTGHARYLLGISEDITERKALEKTRLQYFEARERYAQELESKNHALEESESRYRQLTDASLDAIIVADSQGQITLFNPAAGRIFGYAAADVAGQSLMKLIPARLQAAAQKGLETYRQTRQGNLIGRAVELQGRRRDGTEFPLELSLSAFDLGGQLQFLGAIRDLTERNRMRAMVVQTEKLASIGLLSAGVAHEINNPLAYVANNLVVLERDVKGLMALVNLYEQARPRLAEVDADSAARALAIAEQIDLEYVRENMDRILTRTREGVQRVSKIVQSLRGLARTDRPQLEDASLPDLIDSSLEMIRGQLKRRSIQVELKHDPMPKLRCVSTQIGQVMLNLLVNAMHAVESANRKDGRITVTTRQAGQDLLIEVIDNGCGMDPKDVPRIFDPFYTTKPVGEGTGLGLSISHNIVTAHGGRIEVETERGEGSRFSVYFPLDSRSRGCT